ncbi:hypothetical protein CPI16_06975 [Klebsiella pneumoniae subsp. pneumoniae]|nr:hypothetical protein [Klebsiella pneumoniae subsp. pneumoniae]HBY5782868.1 hypothetical protein [Klebsiella pneumoniae]
MPPAATSWASCLFAVSFRYIMYRRGTLSSIKKPAEAGLLVTIKFLFYIAWVYQRKSQYQ